ncbi:hypothetical protein ACHAXA_005133 [Cyclostephanos tholiformis]|uniref:Peptidase S1 domain-containing protein n=1 Tax=Cyclostephanos tholiformis TaxID=382380 RepID=A0ABD3RX99_9STRA
MVSLQHDFIGGHFCGGSLIAKDIILTTAHCQLEELNKMERLVSDRIALTGYSVVLGRHDHDNNDGEVIAMKAEVPHPYYDKMGSSDNDFMLAFLESASNAGNADLIKLNSVSTFPSIGQGGTAMGLGDTNIRPDISTGSDVLLNVDVTIISNEDCKASMGMHPVDGNYQTHYGKMMKNMLCTRKNGQDSCQADSGGALVVRGDDSSADVQVGIVSWGYGCASSEFPGVYAQVSEAYYWIRTEVCQRSSYASEAGFDCGGIGILFDFVSDLFGDGN